MQRFKQLYKQTAKGQIQVWWMELQGADYRTQSGKLDGKMVVTEWTTAQPTNEGRANARSAEEQARFEVEATYKKQRKAGYKDTAEEAAAGRDFQCMLAQHLVDRWDEVDTALATHGYVMCQRKLDGIRCLSRSDGLWSRKNTPILATPFVYEALRDLLAETGFMLDGELYNHAYKKDRPKIVSLVRKTTGLTPEKVEWLRSHGIAYHIYDLVDTAIPDRDYVDRSALIADIVAALDSPYLVHVPYDVARSREEIDALYEQYLHEGYEGIIVRLQGSYEQKRSPLLLKHKPDEDAEFKVLDVLPGVGDASGLAARVVLAHDKLKGITFKATTTGTEEFRTQLLRNKKKYIGGEVTVAFNGRSPDQIPYFPRTITFYPGGKRNV